MIQKGTKTIPSDHEMTIKPDPTEVRSSTGAPITVVIVDEQGLFREGLANLLETEPDIRVLAKAAVGNEAVGIVRHYRPDVLLVGTDAASPTAVEDLRALLNAAPLSKIVILATRDDPRRVKHLLSSGADAYILKSTTLEELVTTIRVIDRNRDRIVLSVSRQTMNRLRAGSDPMLSDREIEVLTLVSDGLRNSEIASKLFIAEGTVKRHLTNIYAKLGATSRTDAVRRAAKAGLA
ncbi:response regulator transcription factor [Micromonospora sp. FIMYZ51]|uniref:response regulator transcription factor n=1 Tax=Micromonospora sp. FIMYZ51 TaxID=3051832 RepID=UPI00311FFD98